MGDELFVGLMSGTSMDALDAAVVRCSSDTTELLHTLEYPIPGGIRSRINTLSHSGPDEIEQMGSLDRQLGRLFAAATSALLDQAGLTPDQIRAIGSHGQTIRHRPPSAGHGQDSFSLQIADPNTIAEMTGITTVADFRRRDMAAGGEGAPLAPAFHAAVFGSPGSSRAVVNIGGIANISLLQGQELVAGFDCGPGNTLLDHWIEKHQGEHYDRDGKWSAAGDVDNGLLSELLQHPFLQLSGPRSTGKEAFNLQWLDTLPGVNALDPRDVQATLCQFSAQAIADSLRAEALEVDALYVCGGGAHNPDLLRRLAQLLPQIEVGTTAELGVAPDWVEAALFGWLASRTLAGLSGNAEIVTGAAGARVLGAVYPGG